MTTSTIARAFHHGLVAVSLVLGLGLSSPPSARAGDGMRLRTPVLWSDAACMTVVDRSVDPVVQVPYDIPFEDTEWTDDEVPDGRTHQFFALCRGHDPTDELPIWISEADVAAAESLELIDLGTVLGDAILDLDPSWQGCAQRITADDERRPITFAAAQAGFEWDTTGWPAGAWVVEGFTHDPAYSRWSPRPGVIKVVDDPAPSASGPAVAILNGEEVVTTGEAVTIEGCVSAMDGTVLTVAWAEVGESTWHVALADEPVAGEGFGLELLLPPEMSGQAARVRVEAEDPTGRIVAAYMGALVLVLPQPGGCPGECGTSSGSGEGEGGSSDGSDTTAAGSGGGPGADTGAGSGVAGSAGPNTSGNEPGARDEQGGGCACTYAPDEWPYRSMGGIGWWLLGLGLARRRGRRTIAR
ncbi:MAG: hypothetical protein AAGF11_22975 [Myxococcota bacterium]